MARHQIDDQVVLDDDQIHLIERLYQKGQDEPQITTTVESPKSLLKA